MLANCGINYETYGTGDNTILCLHGWGGSTASFAGLINRIVEHGGARAIAVDFPNHGKTPAPDTVWHVGDFKAQILALLDELQLERVDIVAHSFGGRVALLLASENPERVGRMLLTGCAGLVAPKSAKQKLRNGAANAFKGMLESSPVQRVFGSKANSLLDQLQTRFGSEDYRQLTPQMRETFVNIVEEDLSRCLPLIKAPTFLFWGENDTATPLWMGQRMAQEIPDAAIQVVPGADHFAYAYHYEEFWAIAKAFLLTDRG